MQVRLYKITTHFLGKDLDHRAFLGYVVADSDDEVAEHINQKYHYGEWFGYADPSEPDDETAAQRQDYIAHKGDDHTEYAGEFYDQKFGWQEIGEITEEQVAVLRTLDVISDLAVSS